MERERDERHLKYLSLAYYALGCLGAVAACLPGLPCCLGFGLLSGEVSNDPDAEVGGVLVIAGSILATLAVLLVSAALIVNGFLLANRSGYVACLVLAILTSLHAPIGTALGVLTLIVLMRDSVRREFGQ